ncbi:type I secretion system permease/ATPase [Sphingomonas adhaesiva]|uniref:type I secretion system permease/ATPase n=1 Tax=Sphingomonas adhaesiva TaxID=28212 RepID=UPI002FF80110
MSIGDWYGDWTRERDPVLACMVRLAVLHDRPAAPARILTGIALDDDGRLPFHQVEAVAEQLGMNAHPVTRPFARWPVDAAPALLATQGDRAILLLELTQTDALVFVPGRDDPFWTPRAALAPFLTGAAVRVDPDPTAERDAERPWERAVRRHWFWSEAWKMRGALWYVVLAAAVINLLGFAVPLFTMNVYDRVIPNRAAASLWVLAIGAVLALGMELTLRLARARLIDEVGRRLDARLSQKLFEKLLNLPLSQKQGSTGALAKRVSDYEQVRDFFASTTVVLTVDISFLLLFLVMIAVLAGWLVLVPVVGIVAMLVAGWLLQRAMGRVALDAQADSGLQHSALVESIGALETLKAVHGEGRMLGRWRRHAQSSAMTQERFRRLTAISVNLATFCQQAITIGLVVGGFYLFSAGTISMGGIIGIAMIAGRALAPIGQFAFLMTRARQALLTMATLQRMMEQPDERSEGARTIAPTIAAGSLVLDHVGFAYPGSGRASLSDVSLTIRPGERIAIIGRVASGKSTLGKLLCGLHAPGEGSYLIDDIDSRQYQPHAIRETFRYVGQDAELFSGTVRDNLTLAANGADDAQLIEATRKAGADSFLARDAAGFDLLVGERGARLSGGQRSFLVLARAFAAPSRLLFLDEPTGAMDTASEALFVQRMRDAMRPDQTVIVSTHRHALLALVDRLIVIDQGRIVADGPRDAVLAQLAAMGAPK